MGRPWRPQSLVCGSCGYRFGGGSVAVYGFQSIRPLPAPFRALTVPWRLLRTVMGRRSATPNPALYLVAAAAGLAIGTGLALVFGWPWWSVVLACAIALAAASGVFLATAFGYSSGPPGHDLRGDLLRALSPKRAQARADRLEAELFAHPPFALYGLRAQWSGLRQIGGAGSSGPRPRGITSVELLHGDPGPYGERPSLRVRSSTNDDLAHHRRDLEWRLFDQVSRPPPDASGVEMHLWNERRVEERRRRPPPRWSSVRIPVDGEPVAFDLLTERNCWVAVGRAGDVTVDIVAVSWPLDGLGLVRVPDATAYVQGTRQLREQRIREHRERTDGPS